MPHDEANFDFEYSRQMSVRWKLWNLTKWGRFMTHELRSRSKAPGAISSSQQPASIPSLGIRREDCWWLLGKVSQWNRLTYCHELLILGYKNKGIMQIIAMSKINNKTTTILYSNSDLNISILRQTFQLTYLFRLISGICETIVLPLIPLWSNFTHLCFSYRVLKKT